MNARNLTALFETLEESVGKILTILRVEPEEFDETVLMPVITIRALAEEILELTELLPYIHYSLYIKELRKITQKLQNWVQEQPETLELESCPPFEKSQITYI